jgi:1-acyl-sn-glycerol-3-phosphate acyltransferase
MIIVWCRITLRMLQVCNGISYDVQGMSSLPNGPAVLLCKHQSAWETFALLALMPHQLCFVFKRELLWIPFFGWTLGMLHMVHIDRKKTHNAFQAVLVQGRKRLAEGAWIIMFPEGTRIARGKQGRYKSGGARFAIAAKAPIVPIAHNAGRVWPRNSFLKYPGHITISIGPVIPTIGLTPEQANEQTAQWIEAEMRKLDPSAYSA